MKLSQTCSCSAGITVEDEDAKRVTRAVRTWERTHRCLPVDHPADDRRHGVGFAATQLAPDRTTGWTPGWPS